MAGNKEQQEAIEHFKGPCMVIAPPGSGKTFTIIQRVLYLIKKRGVSPQEILVITFTKAAAKEMQERFLSECKGEFQEVTFGTFHAIYFHILKQTYHYTFQNIITPFEKKEILKTVAQIYLTDMECSEDFLLELIAEIGKRKNQTSFLEENTFLLCSKEEFAKIYDGYELEKKRRKKLDFEDMTLFCKKIFLENSEVLELWQKKFPYILVDEFQDINELQYEVLQLLSKKEENLFVVGDDDQAIYGFRGASPQIMLGFENDYERTKKIVLEINYRSSQVIVEAAKRLISHNEKRFEKSVRANQTGGKEIRCFKALEEAEEINYLIGIIKKEKAEEVAVIFRTNEAAGGFAERLLQEKIPFSIRENTKNFYEHFIVRDIFAYLQFIFFTQERKFFLQIMNKPLRYISRASLEEEKVDFEKLQIFYKEREGMHNKIKELKYQFEILKQMPLYAAINYIRKGMGYEEYLKNLVLERGGCYEEYEKIADQLQEKARGKINLEDWLYEVKCYGREMERQKKQQKREGVRLLTIHAAKGLEFKTVLIPNIVIGNIPYKGAQTKEELEEERRLFYVAITRAKENLVLSFCDKKQDTPNGSSCFLSETLLSYSSSMITSSNSESSKNSSKA